ncbi:MAG: trigger factor, partial [Gammaproteobacteria bacterium]|nr:trigger factor [Gammaproteobacteria bacterium]
DELKSNMARELEKTVKNKAKDVVMDALLAANDIEIPNIMIEQESARVAQQMNEQMKQMNQNMPAEMQQFQAEQFKDQGKRRVALGLLLSELIKANEIKVSADKVRAEIDKMAASYHDPKEVVAWYYQDKNRLAEVESMVLEDQVVEWILEHAQVTDNMTTFEEIMKDSR